MSSSGNLIMHEASRERECETDELGWGQGALVKNTTYLYNSRFLPKYPSHASLQFHILTNYDMQYT